MLISNPYSEDFKVRNHSHFASIVRVFLEDGDLLEDENIFLKDLSEFLNINNEEYEHILKHYHTYPPYPVYTFNSRFERLYDLASMVYSEPYEEKRQDFLMRRLAKALGFRDENLVYIIGKTKSLLALEVNAEEFIDEMNNMYI
ncbi:TerB family tellurite resistance protein [Abyssalbus ytuae]|uniref:TerB family tellurite resistance protein n=1 Tax=Abyssalbus ytuae TaxID=2926907 RepID=A0A9E6ZKQ4_9FLAO|nr:TerB family tellurite resistance protein [Abyssalbus ytuae]UOB17522.1 TerB family tellurite resistance protein [Abyssalbus ytuae]